MGPIDINRRFERALLGADGAVGAHCVHELWMRGEMSINIERMLERLWAQEELAQALASTGLLVKGGH